jgi:3-deoxy-7-phosphoheptulonate synthase
MSDHEVRGLQQLARGAEEPTGFVENGVQFGGGAFHVMAGLCAVDTRDNVDAAFAALGRAGQVCARAGAFKPRTSPYDFQGRGAECLVDVFEAAGKHGIRVVAIEVTHERQVDDITRAIDAVGAPVSALLQVGTRNAQNFELLKALGAQKRFPLLLKRGMGISLPESLLAAEYAAAAGNSRIAFCLRGVRTHLAEPHRNLVDFAQVPTVKRMTRMPVCADPSHAVGARVRQPGGLDELHHATAQAVIAGADLLLVDVHPRPEQALVDGHQALTLDELPRFLADVAAVRAAYLERWRTAHALPPQLDKDPSAQLVALRSRFDAIDAQLVTLLAARADAARAAALLKSAFGKPVVDAEREAENARARDQLARRVGVNEALVRDLFDAIVRDSRRLQSE